MEYFNIDASAKKVGNKYVLASVTAKRIKDLNRTSPGLFTEGNVRELSYVLAEVASGKLVAVAK
ncbi:MAG: DNA-directed RNA polymerase subunit omega [Firmicutes bacterium]|nr:DNA-directed RNA polymerase subunit omega [Bacillota bacterium]